MVGRSFEFSGDTLSIGYGNPEARATMVSRMIHPAPHGGDVPAASPWQAFVDAAVGLEDKLARM